MKIDIDFDQDWGHMALEDSYFFNQLSSDELGYLWTITQRKSYDAGTILFYAGEVPALLHVLDKGVVKIIKHDPSGNEIPIAQFHPSDMIAEMAHFEAIPYPATARCESDVEIFEIQFAPFKEHFLNNPKLAFAIIQSMSRKIKQLEAMVQRSFIDDAPTRLARFILDHKTALMGMTQRSIAQQLMLTPETISRMIRRFKNEGWVEVKQKKLVLLNPEGIKQFLANAE